MTNTMKGSHPVVTFLVLLGAVVLLLSVLAGAHPGHDHDHDHDHEDEYDPEEEMMRQREGLEPREKVTVGVLHRPSSCTRRITEGSKAHVQIQLSKVVPSSSKPGETEKVEVLPLKDKLVWVGSGRFLEGVESGLLGACVGEKRSLRIPASLGFAEEGSRKLGVPPDTELRAVVSVQDAEDPDPYGDESMEDMEPDEDMDEPSAHHGNRGEGEDDDDDDHDDDPAVTGPPIPEEEFHAYVPKVDASVLESLTKVQKHHVFVMFYAPWCGHCTAVKPKFAKVARAFRGDGRTVSVVAVDATEEEELAQQYGVEGYPTFFLVKAGAEPQPYNEARTTVAMVEAANRAFGTEREANGMLSEQAGTVAELNVLVTEWQQGSRPIDSLVTSLPEGSYYRRVAESVLAHGKPYIAKEKLRLHKLFKDSAASVKPESLDSMQRRINILNVFDDEQEAHAE